MYKPSTSFTEERFLAAADMLMSLKEGEAHRHFVANRVLYAESYRKMARQPENPKFQKALNGLRLVVYRAW